MLCDPLPPPLWEVSVCLLVSLDVICETVFLSLSFLKNWDPSMIDRTKAATHSSHVDTEKYRCLFVFLVSVACAEIVLIILDDVGRWKEERLQLSTFSFYFLRGRRNIFSSFHTSMHISTSTPTSELYVLECFRARAEEEVEHVEGFCGCLPPWPSSLQV